MNDLMEKYPLPVSDAPKYLIVRDLLIRAISDGHWRPGDRLPTEQEFVAALPFSLGTVQRAYAKLVEEGIVVRKRGRGSFVTRAPAEMREPWHCRFFDRQTGRMLGVYPRIISRKLVTPAEEMRRTLAVEKGEKVLRIDRIINIGQEFDVLSRFYCLERMFPGLAERNVAELESANFKAILLNDYGRPVVDFRQHLSTVPCPGTIASRIGLAREDACLLLEATAFASDGAAVYYQELFIPPTRYKLVLDTRYRPGSSDSR